MYVNAAPRTGAWIEIAVLITIPLFVQAAPRTGAWIEIQRSIKTTINCTRRAPHGRVD